MKRTLLGSMILAGAILGLMAPRAIGRDDEPTKVSLADLRTDLLRKMVAAHAAAYATDKDHAGRARALADLLGGAASVAGKLNYVYKDDKPSILLNATKIGKGVGPSDREAALIAVKDLVGYSLNKVAETSVTVGDDKFTLAKADGKTLAGAVRILWPAPPAPTDTSRVLAARLDALAKELEALKKVEDRVAKLEKGDPALGKKLDDLAAQVKKTADAIEKLEKLLPVILKMELTIKALEGNAKAADDRIKALEGNAKAADDRIKALTDRAVKQDKALVETVVILEKLRVETALALLKQRTDSAAALKLQRDEFVVVIKKLAEETSTGFQKQGNALKVLTDKAAKADDRANAQAKQLEQAEAERKNLDKRLKKAEAILFPPIIHYRVVDRGYYTLCPSQNFGCFGECYPTLRPVWVPCPVYVPIESVVAEPRQSKLDKPKKTTQPTKDGPALPDAMLPVIGDKKRTVRPIVPVYHTDGLTAANAGDIYARGVQLYREGEFASAQARFDAAIRLDGADARSWYFKSLCETALGDSVGAAKSLDRAVVLHLQNKPTADKIGKALERIQGSTRLRFREALEAQRVRR